MTLKSALPGYLWYSGILVQLAIVLMGLQTLAGLLELRPTHRLAAKLSEKLEADKYCATLFRGQVFAWLDPQPFTVDDVAVRGAELVRLAYRNEGSTGTSPEGYHLYRVSFEAEIRDTGSRETIAFPPLAELIFEVNKDDRIVDCRHEPLAASAGAPVAPTAAQDVRYQACEKSGWSRRYLCDRGTERCYPVSQCEPRKEGG